MSVQRPGLPALSVPYCDCASAVLLRAGGGVVVEEDHMLVTHRGDVAAADVVLPLQGRSELDLQLLLVLAGVHQLLVATLQLGLQVVHLRQRGAMGQCGTHSTTQAVGLIPPERSFVGGVAPL